MKIPTHYSSQEKKKKSWSVKTLEPTQIISSESSLYLLDFSPAPMLPLSVVTNK